MSFSRDMLSHHYITASPHHHVITSCPVLSMSACNQYWFQLLKSTSWSCWHILDGFTFSPLTSMFKLSGYHTIFGSICCYYFLAISIAFSPYLMMRCFTVKLHTLIISASIGSCTNYGLLSSSCDVSLFSCTWDSSTSVSKFSFGSTSSSISSTVGWLISFSVVSMSTISFTASSGASTTGSERNLALLKLRSSIHNFWCWYHYYGLLNLLHSSKQRPSFL